MLDELYINMLGYSGMKKISGQISVNSIKRL
jgi:hypothetical protein